MGTYTKKYKTSALEIITECSILPAVDKIYKDNLPPIVSVKKALWDTGSNTTVISSEIVEKLKLKPNGAVVVSGINSLKEEKTYAIHVLLPTGNIASYVEAIENDCLEHDVIIGMDVISKGDFAVTNEGGETYFSFRFPSEKHVDFEQE